MKMIEAGLPEHIPATDAENNPVMIRSGYETGDHQTGQDAYQERIMDPTGPGKESLAKTPFIETEKMVDPEKAANLAFAEEVLVVMVHESQDENDEPYPMVCNGGIRQYFIRGMDQPVRRKYVEILARAKVTKYSMRMTKDFAGNDTYLYIPHTALRYNFNVVEDPAGDKGRQWLKMIQAESM